jgi:hypothetical protein
MNNNSDMEDFMKSICEVLDDLDNINYSLNYQDISIPIKKENNLISRISLSKKKHSGIPLHPNIPSFYNNQKIIKKSIQGIAFLKK